MKETNFKIFYFFLFCILWFNSIIYSQWKLVTNGLQPRVDDTAQVTNGLQYWQKGTAIDACDNNTAIIVVDKTLFKTENAGNAWKEVKYPLSYGVGTDVSIIDKNHFWIATDAGAILATSDGGNNWSKQFYNSTKTEFMNYIKMFDLNNGVAMGDAVGINPFLFLTTEHGGWPWYSVNQSDDQAGFSVYLWKPISFVNSNTGFFMVTHYTYNGNYNSILFRTSTRGHFWLRLINFPYIPNRVVLVKFYNENLGLVGFGYEPYHFDRTTDGGSSWETFNLETTYLSGTFYSDLEFVPHHPSEIWFVDSNNLYFSADTGRTWTSQNIYNGNLQGEDIVFTDSNHGWLLCDSGKVFYTVNNGGMASDTALIKEQLLSGYLLTQNYPNPFNPVTKIIYSLPKQDFVTLKVYDMLGKVIATLVNEEKSAGIYEVEFDGSNLSSGVYFYEIQAGNFFETKKLMLLK